MENLDLLVDTKNGIPAMKWWILGRFSNQSFTRLMNKVKVSAKHEQEFMSSGAYWSSIAYHSAASVWLGELEEWLVSKVCAVAL